MNVRIVLVVCWLLITAGVTVADDVGITEVRLIEEDANIYALEADVSAYLLNTIERPILPARCRFLGEVDRVTVGTFLIIRFRFTCEETLTGSSDQIMLPWQRSGVAVTAYWLDGSSRRVFFNRELAGIRIPVQRLRAVELSKELLLTRAASDAFDYIRTMGWMHLLLVLACASLGRPRRMAGLLLSFAAGHGLALVAADIGVPSIRPAYGVIFIAVASLLMFRASLRETTATSRFWPVLLVLGLFHGLGYAGPDIGAEDALSSDEFLIASFAFNTTIDLLHGLLAVIAWAVMLAGDRLQLASRVRHALSYLGGGLVVALAVVALPGALAPADLAPATKIEAASGVPSGLVATRSASRPVEVTDPLMGFATVTAFEVRVEWLVRARDLATPAATTESGARILPVAAQAAFKDDLMRQFTDETLVTVDGAVREAAMIRADFVTVGTYGVTMRTTPIPERVDSAVVGVSIAYPVDEAPKSVSLRLRSYPTEAGSIPFAVSDPWGAMPFTLTRDEPGIDWERRMAGFRRPVIQAVTIPPPTWPFVSVGLLAVAGGVMFAGRRKRMRRPGTRLAWVCIAAAIVVYPFLRIPAPSALASRLPVEADTHSALTQLLTNIYRAFNYRTEDAIYDRLAVSATGDQLSSIYLEHIRAMELENRGGARASVDNVEVDEIRDVTASAGGLSVDAAWTVGGSVSHFGHTHYRKNRYSAIVRIVRQEGAWKISGIDVKEEERVL